MTARDPILEQRVVELISEADAGNGNRSGRPRLVAFGYGHVAELAGVSPDWVRQASAAGQFDLRDLRSVIAWVDSRRRPAPPTVVLTSPPLSSGTLHPGGRITFEGLAKSWEPGPVGLDDVRVDRRPAVGFITSEPGEVPVVHSAHPAGCGSSECDDDGGSV